LGFDDAILTHGEAVALGCALAFRFSVRRGHCAPDEVERLQAVLAAVGLPTGLSGLAPLSADALIARMAGDKKAQGGRITLILAHRIGEAFVETGVDPATLRAFLVAEGATA
jgi:3-dehydroquinate synthase